MRLAIDLRLRNYNAKKWTPKALSPKLWLSSDAGVTLNGSLVSAWADQSGSGNHFSQGNADNQPLFISSAVNGKPALQFSGHTTNIVAHSTDYLRANAMTGFTTESSIVCVIKPITGNNQNMIVSQAKPGAPYNGFEAAFDGGSPTAGGLGRWTGSWSWSTNKLSFNDYNVGGVYGYKDATSGFVKSGVNGSSYADIFTGNTATILDAVTNVVNCDIGRAPWGGVYAKMYLCEVVIVNRLLTADERAKLVAYLKAKYGIV